MLEDFALHYKTQANIIEVTIEKELKFGEHVQNASFQAFGIKSVISASLSGYLPSTTLS